MVAAPDFFPRSRVQADIESNLVGNRVIAPKLPEVLPRKVAIGGDKPKA